jgi:predicted dehydrogenase
MNGSRKAAACIVGSGFIGPAHIEALRRNGIAITGLVEQDAASAREKAARLGLPRGYASYEEALADPAVTVVHLAVPNSLHFPYAKAALEAGKHVLCEKPLATTSEESAELVALAKSCGLVAAVNYNLRFYPLVHEARALVRDGKLGKPFLVHGAYLQDWLLLDTDWSWRLDPSIGGKLRAVADIGTHWLDMVSFVTGLRVESVFAELATFYKERLKPKGPVETFAGKTERKPGDYERVRIETEDAALILLRFEGGARGSLTVSQVSAGRKNSLSFEVDGSAKALAWDSESPNSLWVGERSEPNRIVMKDPSLLSPEAARLSGFPGGHQEGYPDTLKNLIARLYAYIEAGDYSAPRDFPSFEDGHEEMLLCDAILKSSIEGRWVTVSGRPKSAGERSAT